MQRVRIITPGGHDDMRPHRLARAAGVRARPILLVASALAVAVLHGCGASAPRTGVLVRTEALATAFEAGMSIAPLTATSPLRRDPEVATRMTEELYATLFAGEGGALLIPPDDVLGVLEAGGAANQDFFERFRSDLAAGRRPPDDDFVRLSRMVQHRFLFVGWYEESTSEGVETGAGDYREPGFAEGVTNTRFAEVNGRIEAMLLDLWEADVVWHGVETYRTDRLYRGGAAAATAEDELERARVDAAARIAHLLERS